MSLLNIGGGKYINLDRITYIKAKSRDKVRVMFQTEVSCGGIGIPASYLEVRGDDAERLLRWLETNADRIGG
jgi:hypothetical protein